MKSPLQKCLALTAALGILSGCTTIIPETLLLNIDVGETQTVVRNTEKTEWGWGTHPALAYLQNGKIGLTYWIVGDGGTRGKNVINWPMHSNDGGASWVHGDPRNISGASEDEMFTLQPGDKVSGYTMGYYFAEMKAPGHDHVLHKRLFHREKKQSHLTARQLVKKENSPYWETRVANVDLSLIPRGNELEKVAAEKPAVVDHEGTWWLSAFGRLRKEKLSTFLLKSTDGGVSWQAVGTIARPQDARWGSDGPCESTLLITSKGTFICIMRTGMERQYNAIGPNFASKMLLARSEDQGETWSHERLTFPGVYPCLLEMEEGLIACAFGRPGNNIIFSLDDGRSWGSEISLTSADTVTTGYIDILQTDPNRLIAVYDIFRSSPQRFWLWGPPAWENRIYAVPIEVRPRWSSQNTNGE